MKKTINYAILALFTAFLGLVLGCSDQREEEFRRYYASVVCATETKIDEHLTHGYDARIIRRLVQEYVGRTSFDDICIPFICYAALKFEPAPFPNGHKDDPPMFHFQWGGVLEPLEMERCLDVPSDICFTFLMLTTNDLVRVISFERRRNSGNRCGLEGKYFRYLNGYSKLSIWDGHLNDLNRPEEIFTEPYKDVFAVQSRMPFNYDLIYNPTTYYVAKKEWFKKENIFRMVWRTKECMLFLPVVLFDAPGQRSDK